MKLPPLLAVAALLSPHCTALAQEMQLKDLLGGNGPPSALRIADLGPEYKALRLKSSGGGGAGADLFGMMMSPFMMLGMMFGGATGTSSEPAAGGGPDASMIELMGVLDTSWTKAETIRLGGHEYLVTYKTEMGMAKPGEPGGRPPFGVGLKLTLVRTDMLVSIAPLPELTPDRFRAVLAQAKVPIDGELTPLPGDLPAALLLGGSSQGKDASKEASSLSHAKQLAVGLHMYASDWDDILPYPQSMKALQFVAEPYLKNVELWQTLNPLGSEWRFNRSLGGVALADIPNPAETVLLYETEVWPDGKRTVAFVDMSARRVSAEEWNALQPGLTLNLKRRARPLPMNYGIGGSEP